MQQSSMYFVIVTFLLMYISCKTSQETLRKALAVCIDKAYSDRPTKRTCILNMQLMKDISWGAYYKWSRRNEINVQYDRDTASTCIAHKRDIPVHHG